MSFSKELVSSDLGSVSVSESAGVVSLVGMAKASLGGGAAAGVASIDAKVAINLEVKHLVDLGLDLAAEKFPAVKSLIDAAKAVIDAELAKP